MPKTADVVAARVRTAILEQQLPPGSSLPGELELIEHFGVSRASIREALRLLEAEGLIEVRRGVRGGVFTVEPSTSKLTARDGNSSRPLGNSDGGSLGDAAAAGAGGGGDGGQEGILHRPRSPPDDG